MRQKAHDFLIKKGIKSNKEMLSAYQVEKLLVEFIESMSEEAMEALLNSISKPRCVVPDCNNEVTHFVKYEEDEKVYEGKLCHHHFDILSKRAEERDDWHKFEYELIKEQKGEQNGKESRTMASDRPNVSGEAH